MNEIFLEVLWSTLTASTAAFMAVIIPFSGAYWLFKRSSKASAETSLFQLGSEIADELRNAKDVLSPLGGIYYHYINKAFETVHESDRDHAIYKLAQQVNTPFFDAESKFADSKDAALLYVAIISERLDSLIPYGVTWSGKGPVFSPWGEDITVEDSLFPFGTKLYRAWIKRFGMVYNTLWICMRSYRRNEFVTSLDASIDHFSAADLERWLESVGKKLDRLHRLHAKSIIQLQIVDSVINEAYFRLSLLACSVYLLLLSTVGYFLPLLLLEANLHTLPKLALLATAALALAGLIIMRLFGKSGQLDEKFEVRRTYILPLLNRSEEITKKRALGYGFKYLEHTLSKAAEMELPQSVVSALEKLATEIQDYNSNGEKFLHEAKIILTPLTTNFVTPTVNQGGFSVDIQDIADDNFDLVAICDRIVNDSGNFEIQCSNKQTTHVLHKVDLSSLTGEVKANLAYEIRELRGKLQSIGNFRTITETRGDLDRDTRKLRTMLRDVLRKEPFDLAIRLSRRTS